MTASGISCCLVCACFTAVSERVLTHRVYVRACEERVGAAWGRGSSEIAISHAKHDKTPIIRVR